MTNKNLPKVKFSKWYKWRERKNIVDIDYPGVYMLAKLTKVPAGKANQLHKDIIYFGETCTTLKKRINAFHRSAYNSKKGHSAGHTYRDSDIYEDKGNNLYVSIMPIKENNYFRDFFIRYLERKLIFYYTLEHGERPKLNKK